MSNTSGDMNLYRRSVECKLYCTSLFLMRDNLEIQRKYVLLVKMQKFASKNRLILWNVLIQNKKMFLNTTVLQLDP